jgi:DNA-binding IclR family transcriptional regulator
MLAFMDPDERGRILSAHGLPAVTATTITDPKRLENELGLIRERGYSTDKEENEGSTFCVGAPIFDHLGFVIGAASVSSNSETLVSTLLDATAAGVLDAADRISRRMGYVPSRPPTWDRP